MAFYFKYVKVYNTTDPSQVIDLFFSLYKRPELLISVTGGASLNLSQKSLKTICNGIIKVASTTSTFLLSTVIFNSIVKFF